MQQPTLLASTSLLACDRANTVMHRATSATSTAYAHTPFGQHSPATRDDPRPGFNGQHLERNGSYLLGNGYRAYNPRLERFSTPDNLSPFGAGGLNAYMYCAGDPVNRRDPSGHDWEDIAGGLAVGLGFLMAALGGGLALKNGSANAAHTYLIAGGLATAAFGTTSLVVPDEKFKRGALIAAGATVLLAFGGVAASKYSKHAKVKAVAKANRKAEISQNLADGQATLPTTPELPTNGTESLPRGASTAPEQRYARLLRQVIEDDRATNAAIVSNRALRRGSI
jgi:RHS repeat-associated protein